MEIGRQKVKQLGLENTISFAKEDCLNLSYINVDFYIAGVGVIHVLATIATYVALVLTIVSLIDYLNKNKAVLKEQD